MGPLSSLALAAAALGARPELRAQRTEKPPVIDGRVDDAAWKAAPVSGAFTQKIPNDGQPPSEPTRIRVLYDDKAIYVAVECVQRTSEIVAPLTRRDREVETDRVTVAFATRGDSATAFEFIINPAGVIADATRFDDTQVSRDWDGNWVGQAAKTAEGWSAELSIPLRVLRFEERPEQTFGFQVRRYTSRRQETDEWAHIPRSEPGEVSRYGRLTNLVGLKKGATFELRPFVVGRLGTRDKETAPFSDGFSPSFSAGADFKWLVLPSLTLDGAINPDFGQVDADKVVLNLSNYEVYFPEKRPFFLESADVFQTPLQLVYTRRVGLAPFPPEIPEGEGFRTTPDPSPIYGAMKLTGNIGDAWSVGALLAVAGSSSAETQDRFGRRQDRVASALSMVKVLRLRRNFEGGSNVGVLFTGVSRLESPDSYPRAAGEDGTPRQLCPNGEQVPLGERCENSAYAMAVDGRYRFLNNNYSLTGQLAGTLIQGGPPREQRDGTVIRSGDVDPAAKVQLKKEGGGHVRGGVTYELHGRKADYNALGYMQRQNKQLFDMWMEYGTNGPFSRFNDGYLGFYFWGTETLDHVSTGRGGGVFLGGQFKNLWRSLLEVFANADYTDDREIGGGALFERPGALGVDIGMNTDERSNVLVNLFTGPRFLTNGAFNVSTDASLRVRALPQLELELAPSFSFTTGERRFYGQYDDLYLFGALDAASLSATLSATYTFLPSLTLQAYGQAFVAFGRYHDFEGVRTRLPAPRIFLADLSPARLPVDEIPAFVDGAFNANLVLRWEYRLGSTVFFVYTHGQSDSRTPRSSEAGAFDFRLTTPRPAADVFLIKVSYWWG